MLKNNKSLIILYCILISIPLSLKAWGFWGHMRINRQAIFSLPPEMIGFYKANIEYITDHAVDPDKRRYAIEGEAPKHYIDLDHYCILPCKDFPKPWDLAVEYYSEDSLQAYGIVPWHIQTMLRKLTRAFKEQNATQILKFSTDLGHYIADAHVPLHTTKNYNGQLSNQNGIHGFWESRLPELFHEEYNFFVGKASYIADPLEFTWENILNAHSKVDQVLDFEKKLDSILPTDKKFSFETRNNQTLRTYSKEYSKAYHLKLQGMVEQQMRQSIKHTADLWYTCWVNAGKPNLQKLKWNNLPTKEEKANLKIQNTRQHPATGETIFD